MSDIPALPAGETNEPAPSTYPKSRPGAPLGNRNVLKHSLYL
jgi:hypothetical protein